MKLVKVGREKMGPEACFTPSSGIARVRCSAAAFTWDTRQSPCLWGRYSNFFVSGSPAELQSHLTTHATTIAMAAVG